LQAVVTQINAPFMCQLEKLIDCSVVEAKGLHEVGQLGELKGAFALAAVEKCLDRPMLGWICLSHRTPYA
jgi:hypothetical protein